MYSVNELLYSSKNEWITVKLYNMVDSQKYNFEKKEVSCIKLGNKPKKSMIDVIAVATL